MLVQYSRDEWRTTNGIKILGYKNITHFILERGHIFCSVRETDGDKRSPREMNTACHIDPALLHLTIPHCLIFKTLRLLFRWDVLKRSSSGSQAFPLRPRSLSADSAKRCKLRLNQIWNWPCHVGICIYHFIKPTHFRSTTWLLPLIFTSVFRAGNLNMQH